MRRVSASALDAQPECAQHHDLLLKTLYLFDRILGLDAIQDVQRTRPTLIDLA